MKYIVLHHSGCDYVDTKAFVLEVENPSEVRQAFFTKILGLVDGKVPRHFSTNDLTMVFWLEEDEFYTFYHVDEEFQIKGLVAEGQELAERLAEEHRETEEQIQKQYRYERYLKLKEEFEPDDE